MSNLNRVQTRMSEIGLPAMLVTDIVNVQWMTGFTGSFGQVLVTPSRAFFITSAIYDVQSKEQVKDCEIVCFSTPRQTNEVIAELLSAHGITKLGFESSVTFQGHADWKKAWPDAELSSAGDILPPLRMIKTADEIEKIQRACALADACFTHVLRMVQVGVTEYDLGLEVEFYFRRQGAKNAFDVIAVSGANSAKPHGKPSEKKLEPGDFLTFDFGALLDGYNSDMTRTVVVGKATDRHKMIYNRVLESEVAAIEVLKAGNNGRDADRLAREILDKDDLSKYFGHSLGHGLGRAVHDYGRLSIAADQPLEVGQVWTVEPGVYIEGFGGVRIEDDVVITESGPKILTHSPKELLELG